MGMKTSGSVAAFDSETRADISEIADGLRRLYGLPGLGLFVRHGSEKLVGGFGLASISFDVPVCERTLFHVGSLGKQITATLFTKKVMRQGVSPEATVGEFVSDIPRAWGDATLRQLLCHTSGIPDYIPHVPMDLGLANAEVYRQFAEVPMRFHPGTAFEYSNTNYRLIGDVIEVMTGQSYATLVGELFEEAALLDGGVDDAAVILPHQATPYVVEDGTVSRALDYYRINIGSADGGVRLSPRDAAAWDRAFWGGQLLSDSEVECMTQPHHVNSGALVPYGFGWMIDRGANDDPLYWHDGTMPGFRAIYIVSPRHELVVYVLSNSLSRTMAEEHIAHAVAERLVPESTVLGAELERDPHPELTRSAGKLMFADRRSLDLSMFTSEIRPLIGGLRTLASVQPPDQFSCVQETEEDCGPGGTGLLRRYRMRWNQRLRHVAIAYTEDERIYRLWSC